MVSFLYEWPFFECMVQRIGTARRKTRQKFSKSARTKGKVSLRRFLQVLETGDGVVLKAEPAVQKGMYHGRFHGKHGKIVGMRGKCYEVMIKINTKVKKLIVHPVHLRKV